MVDEIKPVIPDAAKEKLLAAVGQLQQLKEEAEAVPALPAEGKDLNFDLYEVEDGIKHLYRRAKLVGDQYVVDITEWYTISKNYSAPLESTDKDGTPRNLGAYITMMSNSPDGWQLFNVLPNGSGLGAPVFRRVVRQPLPPLVAVGEKLNEQLSLLDLEDATKKWAQEQGAPEAQES